MNPRDRRFLVAAATMTLAGACVGFALSRLPRIAPYKLLNIAGILYGLLGVIVLAELVMKSDALKKVMVTYVAGGILWASTLIPLGMFIGAGVAYVAGQPSAAATAGWSLSFVFGSVLPLSAVDATVVLPTRLINIDVHGRHQILGLALLVGGGTLQLAAAVVDLLN